MPETNKIGIMGGTFDPVHNGHIKIAKEALKEYKLDTVIFVPSGVSYMKSGVSDAGTRYRMCALAIENEPQFQISDVDIVREGNTYTYETIECLQKQYPEAVFYLIIGLDTLYTIETWKNIERLFANAHILCAGRTCEYAFSKEEQAEYLSGKYGANIDFLQADVLDVSSTNIRECIRLGKNTLIKELLPQKVYEYIMDNHLYSYEEYLITEIGSILKPKRLQHTIGVKETAVALARKYGVSVLKAQIAALLHDMAKHMDVAQMQSVCAKYEEIGQDRLYESPALLHGRAGAYLAKERYALVDDEIFDAIYYHTTGKPDMSMLTKIIFVSDYIEPNRSHSDKLPFLRELAFDNLDRTVAIILKDTLDYLENQTGVYIDNMTEQTYLYYKKWLTRADSVKAL